MALAKNKGRSVRICGEATDINEADLCLQTMCSFCFTVSQIKNAWLSLMNVFLNSRNTRLNQLRKKYHEEYYFGKKSLMLLQ